MDGDRKEHKEKTYEERTAFQVRTKDVIVLTFDEADRGDRPEEVIEVLVDVLQDLILVKTHEATYEMAPTDPVWIFLED